MFGVVGLVSVAARAPICNGFACNVDTTDLVVQISAAVGTAVLTLTLLTVAVQRIYYWYASLLAPRKLSTRALSSNSNGPWFD